MDSEYSRTCAIYVVAHNYVEFASVAVYRQIFGINIRAFVKSRIYGFGNNLLFEQHVFRYIFKFRINNARAVPDVEDTAFFLSNILFCFESLKMLVVYPRKNRILRIYDFHEFFDVADTPCTEFGNENFVRIVKRIDGFCNSHRRIVALRRTQNIVFLRQNRFEKILYRRFAVTSRNCDFYQIISV